MIRRMGRPGLIGTMARTAVIAGTATAVTGGMQRRQMARADAAQQQQQQTYDAGYEAAQQQPSAPAAPAPSGGNDLLAQIEQLSQLKAAGVLDDAEFSAAKAKLLGG